MAFIMEFMAVSLGSITSVFEADIAIGMSAYDIFVTGSRGIIFFICLDSQAALKNYTTDQSKPNWSENVYNANLPDRARVTNIEFKNKEVIT